MLSNDWVIRYDARFFQVARQSHQAPAKSTVLVRENAAGAIEMRYRGRVMHWSEIPAPPPKPVVTTATRPAMGPACAPARRGGQSADHPWRHLSMPTGPGCRSQRPNGHG